MRKKTKAPDIPTNAKVWLGVSRDEVDERSMKDWWCVPGAAQPGDLLLLYQRLEGIVRMERITSDADFPESRCLDLALKTVRTSYVATLDRPITARQLRTHRLLRDLPAVRRNFQGTVFRVPQELWPVLRELFKSKLAHDSAEPTDRAIKKAAKELKARDIKKREKKSGSEADLDFYL
jgi:hypothetical protein